MFPNKDAVVFDGTTLSYADLARSIHTSISEEKNVTAKSFVFNRNPIETLCSVLASNALNRAVVVVPADYPEKNLEIEQEEPVPSGAFIGILTSGSSGKPKTVWKSNDNWELAFKHQSEIFGISKSEKLFVLDALSYSANLNAALHILWEGGTLVLGQLKKARRWKEMFEEAKVSSCFLVPSHCQLLLNNGIVNDNIKSLVTAGEKLSAKMAKELLERFPASKLTEYYGAAELGHITYHQNADIYNFPHSVGKPFPQVKVVVKDNKVTVSSPFVSSEYKENGTVDDLGYFDKGDRLVLKGRSGRMFNRRALNIYAQEIENIALTFDSVQKAVLVESEINKRLNLYFTTNSKALGNDEEELAAFLKQCLPKAKMPSFVKELEEIPHSETGKVDFRALSKMSGEGEILNIAS
ncbi:AMP-binding protein [uncultured Arcticibacterium sp.]|uniref:AMP-binding protein n=1 Tax=uncultured Arcticibacterium sp. TaxID=2173042 RepID=UPI0030F9658B